MTTPARLLRRTWFYVSLYWCRRGREGQRDLRRDSFKFTHDAYGREYAVMTHEEATKNHPSGENSKPSAERETRLYSTGADDDASVCQSEFVCSKTKPILHSVFSSIQNQACQRKTPFGTKTDHLVSTSWATHDENYLCWSRALLDINQPLRQGVCDYFAVSNANVPAATSCSFQGKAASKVSHTTSQGHL